MRKGQLQTFIIKVKPVVRWRQSLSNGQHCRWPRKQDSLSQCISLFVPFFCYWPRLKSLPLKFCLLVLGWKCWEESNKWTRTLTCQKRVLFPTIILAQRTFSVQFSLCGAVHDDSLAYVPPEVTPPPAWQQLEPERGTPWWHTDCY